MLMHFEVFGQLVNACRQNRDLHLWRTSIRSMDTGVRNNFFFLFNSQCHACKSPAFLFLSEYKKVLPVRIITWIAQGRNELHMSEDGSIFLRFSGRDHFEVIASVVPCQQTILLDCNFGTNLSHFGGDLLSFFLRDSFLDRLGGLVDNRLCLFQA